jgi:hypothetical protein
VASSGIVERAPSGEAEAAMAGHVHGGATQDAASKGPEAEFLIHLQRLAEPVAPCADSWPLDPVNARAQPALAMARATSS